MIADVLDGLRIKGAEGDGEIEQRVRAEVHALCARFPIYGA
jgi:glycine hydroxymethyltransferase